MGFLRSKTKKSKDDEDTGGSSATPPTPTASSIDQEGDGNDGGSGGEGIIISSKEEEVQKMVSLPSEQDRKAIMGCLSCILWLIFHYPDAMTFVTTEEEKANAVVDCEEGENSNQEGENIDQEEENDNSTEVAKEDADGTGSAEEKKKRSVSSSIKSSIVKGSTRQKSNIKQPSQSIYTQQQKRAVDFQKEMMTKSSALLLLDEEYSTVYIELLENDDDNGIRNREFHVRALKTYLGSLSNKKNGFKCLALLLFRFLLLSSEGALDETVAAASSSSTDGKEDKHEESESKSSSSKKKKKKEQTTKTSTIVGYDARVRRTFKCLAVAMLAHFEEEEKKKDDNDNNSTISNDGETKEDKSNATVIDDAVGELNNKNINKDKSIHIATTQPDEAEAFSSRKFEALEDDIGWKLWTLSKFLEEEQRRQQEEEKGKGRKWKKTQKSNQQISERKREKTNRQKVIRGLKIGTAGVVAGTLLAVTGGMAAPAIAAGIAAVAGGTAIATVATIALSSAVAVTTVFGVGGGALVATKMDKRTRGLTEFQIKSEREDNKGGEEDEREKAELSRTVCISGWLRDGDDFRRPWGATFLEELREKETLLRWFFSIKDPSRIGECSSLLSYYEGKEDELWLTLGETYGKDPDMLLTTMVGSRKEAALTDQEDDAVNTVIEALGFPRPASRSLQASCCLENCEKVAAVEGDHSEDDRIKQTSTNDGEVTISDVDDLVVSASVNIQTKGPKNVSDLWNFHAEYGGELYTVRWESQMIQEISNSVKNLAKDLAGTTTKEVLKHTTMAALMTAIALPAGILSVANMIDSSWTIALERADEAGVELAHSLLESNAGHRPINLVGYSLGARVIYKCLRELSRHQEKWELQQDRKVHGKKGSNISTIHEKDTNGSDASSDEVDDSKKAQRNFQQEEMVYAREPASILEDVILMGCPVSVNPNSWASCRRVVGGRFVNCFSPEDMILTLMFRYKNMKSMLRSVSGIAPLNAPGIENYDVSVYIKYHSDYCFAAKDILALTGYGQPRLQGLTSHSRVVTLETKEKDNLKITEAIDKINTQS